MHPDFNSRRVFTASLLALPACGLAAEGTAVKMTSDNGLARSAEAIHDELVFSASRSRIYGALTDAKQFDLITRLSDAKRLVTAPGAKATTISTHVGGAFTLFGGYVTGFQLELVRDERLVQAWRAASWGPGEYSVVRFQLGGAGAETRLIFDHGGFPAGRGPDLASGWFSHYWEPLKDYLAQ